MKSGPQGKRCSRDKSYQPLVKVVVDEKRNGQNTTLAMSALM